MIIEQLVESQFGSFNLFYIDRIRDRKYDKLTKAIVSDWFEPTLYFDNIRYNVRQGQIRLYRQINSSVISRLQNFTRYAVTYNAILRRRLPAMTFGSICTLRSISEYTSRSLRTSDWRRRACPLLVRTSFQYDSTDGDDVYSLAYGMFSVPIS